MRGIVLFIAGLICGLAVQTTMAQNDAAGVVLNHVGLSVPSIPDAAAFYTQKMGFKEAFRNSDAQGNPTAIGLIHGNATSSPPIPDRLWADSIGVCGFTG